jgi:endogenous inhibitor of DNA gyrase (YacG/DUF329 family)
MTSCAHCGRPITITSRNPNRRYCSPRCRVADWHARQRQTPAGEPTDNDMNNDLTNDVTNEVANLVRDDVTNAVPAANGVQHCPNCRQPLAVISVLVPAAAAHIRTPEVIT